MRRSPRSAGDLGSSADETVATRAPRRPRLGLTRRHGGDVRQRARGGALGRALADRRATFLRRRSCAKRPRAGTLAACERSLRRLRTDRLDLYLLHWPGEHPLSETLAAFDELQRRGAIRHFGVSNFDERELAEAVRIAGPGRIACNQVLYHLGERAIEHAVLPACARLGVALVASLFGSGLPSASSGGGRALAEIAASTERRHARWRSPSCCATSTRSRS